MKIKTEFKPGDTVYYISESEFRDGVVMEVSIKIDRNNIESIHYYLENGCNSFKESVLFKSIEQLSETHKNILLDKIKDRLSLQHLELDNV